MSWGCGCFFRLLLGETKKFIYWGSCSEGSSMLSYMQSGLYCIVLITLRILNSNPSYLSYTHPPSIISIQTPINHSRTHMYDYSTPVTGFQKGTYYMLVCRANEQAVRVEQNKNTEHYKSRLVGTKINPQDTNTVFMVERVDEYGTNYEIVCCASDYVFEADGQEIVLNDGKQSKHQLFNLFKAPATNTSQYYFLKLASRPDQALSLEGCLRLSTFDPNNATQQFRLEEVNNITIQNSCLIVSNYSGKVIDVPGATEKQGERIVVWERNRRWNQRWYFQKVGSVFLIKNILSGHCLDIAGQSRESGAKIVQWPQTGGTNQLWHIQEAGNKIYKIWSHHEPSLSLAIRKQETSDGSYVEVCSGDNPTMYWRIQGALPR